MTAKNETFDKVADELEDFTDDIGERAVNVARRVGTSDAVERSSAAALN